MGWKELLQQTPSPSKQSEKAGDLLTFIWSHPLFHPFLHVCMLVASVVSDSLQPSGLEPTRLLCPCRFFRQGYWSRLKCPPPGDLPDLGIKPTSLYVSCIGRQILYQQHYLGSPFTDISRPMFFCSTDFGALIHKTSALGFPGGLVSKESAWIGKIPWKKEWLPTPIFLPGESHGQRSIAGYSP